MFKFFEMYFMKVERTLDDPVANRKPHRFEGSSLFSLKMMVK